MHIGLFCKKVREEKGISARELSARSGYSSSYVSKLENGQIQPTVAAFGKIAEALKLSAMEVGVAVYTSVDEGADAEKGVVI